MLRNPSSCESRVARYRPRLLKENADLPTRFTSFQILELKLFITLVNQTFFLEQVPDELADSEETEVNETITRTPRETWVRLRRWEDE